MANKAMDTTLLDRAIQFAVKAHGGTERRGKGFPYVVHPLEAVAIAATISPDQEILAAAALHDVLEDTWVTAEELEKEFGHRVTQLVMEETDKFFAGISEAQSWTERKKIAMERLKNASRDAKIVAMGDKLSNAREMNSGQYSTFTTKPCTSGITRGLPMPFRNSRTVLPTRNSYF